MFLSELFVTEQSNTVSIIFGRFNPPHKGHVAAWQIASKSPAWYIGTNQNTHGSKDPLPYAVKYQAMSAICPGAARHIVPTQSWLTLASEVFAKHGNITLACCTDEDWVTPTIAKYNRKQGPHGFYDFPSITQVQTPRLSSATSLRASVSSGDRNAFATAAGVPVNFAINGTPYFNLVANYLGTVSEHIVKHGDEYRLLSKKTGKNLGTYPTKAAAKKREQQIQYFKHAASE